MPGGVARVAASDGMSAVEDSTNMGGITTTGNFYTDAGCN